MSNTNGLTFEQWAIAARVAKFRGDEFIPMGEGYTYFSNCPENRNTKLIQRKYRYNYAAHIRKAWADGVDPTDWSACIKRDASHIRTHRAKSMHGAIMIMDF